MSSSKRKRKEQAMSDQKKPPEPPRRPDPPAQQKPPPERKDEPHGEPHQPPAGPTLAPGERVTGEPKEKQQDAPGTSENEQSRVRAEKQALAEAKATDQEGHLRPELQKLQAQHAQEAPPAAKLRRPEKDEMGTPASHPPTAPLAGKGAVPRFIDGNERATPGLTRFRVRSDSAFGPQPARYVLARDEKEAGDHYVLATGIGKLIERLGEDAPDPMLSVTRLPD